MSLLPCTVIPADMDSGEVDNGAECSKREEQL